MTYLRVITFFLFLTVSLPFALAADTGNNDIPTGSEKAETDRSTENIQILSSLIELQKSLKEQIANSKKKLKSSISEAEKNSIQEELTRLDTQLNEAVNDFERIATGVEVAIFAEKKPETFSWKDELNTLIEPAIKELKRLTIRARQKTKLKDSITEYRKLSLTADEAVVQLTTLLNTTEDKQIKAQLNELLPEWKNIANRLSNKLELAELELSHLEEQEVSLVESSSNTVRIFFRDRGLYLILAVLTFAGVLIGCSLIYKLTQALLPKQKKDKPIHIRALSLIYRVTSFTLAVFGLFLVLYLAEDWFLLSMAIVFLIALILTVRQGIPRLWQQGRIMLNVGSVREGERVVLDGVPWRIDELNIFCRLSNPALQSTLRIPIEDMVGKTSRPYNREEPWFPCKKGDWVTVSGNTRGKVVSLSPEAVELVERGGTRVYYTTSEFLCLSPCNLSRNFRLRIPFGISYLLQKEATGVIPALLRDYLQERLEQEGYSEDCLQLSVEFMQANASSLDLMILADFRGGVADIKARLDRFLNRCCVEACTKYQWEIPYPQLTVHTVGETSPSTGDGTV